MEERQYPDLEHTLQAVADRENVNMVTAADGETVLAT